MVHDRHSLAAALAPALDRLATPALVIDLDAVDHNIAAVVRRCGADRWRPHLKTVKSAAVIDRLLAHGVTACKVATLDELDLVLAAADARAVAVDVLLAYPLHPAALRAALARAARSPRARVAVLADDPTHAAALAAARPSGPVPPDRSSGPAAPPAPVPPDRSSGPAAPPAPVPSDLSSGPSAPPAPVPSDLSSGPSAPPAAPPAPVPSDLSSGPAAPAPLRVFLDVDLGMARTGAPPAVWAAAAADLAALPGLEIAGLHGYDGHWAWDDAAAAAAAYDALCDLADRLRAAGLPLGELVTSGTHSYASALAHPRLAAGPPRHRISPGTVVLSDLRSHAAAADLGLRQAAFVAARAISRAPGRLTLDAGSKAIAPDRPAATVALLGWPDLRPVSASEEHLVVRVPDGAPAPARGDLVLLVPDHVCTTVNLYRRALLLRGGAVAGDAAIEAASHRLWLEPA